jgi:hypothetical protein
MVMRSTGLLASLGLVVSLAACSNASDERKVDAAFRDGSDDAATSPPQPGFGGVIEVTFSAEDAAVQDALATECGLVARPLTGVAASPPGLPPGVRWHPKPSDVDAAIACMRRQEGVRRVSLPL